MKALILTFGYGNRKDYSELKEAISSFNVGLLVDVRLKPRAWTRRWWGDQISAFCEASGIDYASEPSLGNVSGKAEWIPPDKDAAKRSLERLSERASDQTILLLCAELDHNRCHRTQVADELNLLVNGKVRHVA
ncbi:MAG: DUF488 domain-containing protein [Cyanobacteria bacterium J06554_6]